MSSLSVDFSLSLGKNEQVREATAGVFPLGKFSDGQEKLMRVFHYIVQSWAKDRAAGFPYCSVMLNQNM